MALAIRFDELTRDGVVVDEAESVRVGCVSRARSAHIMNCLSLARQIQEAFLARDHAEISRLAVPPDPNSATTGRIADLRQRITAAERELGRVKNRTADVER